MDDLISRQAAVDVAKQHWYKPDIAKALEELPSAEPKPLKYTGESFCVYCHTVNCDGCMYEPMKEVRYWLT